MNKMTCTPCTMHRIPKDSRPAWSHTTSGSVGDKSTERASCLVKFSNHGKESKYKVWQGCDECGTWWCEDCAVNVDAPKKSYSGWLAKWGWWGAWHALKLSEATVWHAMVGFTTEPPHGIGQREPDGSRCTLESTWITRDPDSDHAAVAGHVAKECGSMGRQEKSVEVKCVCNQP